MREWLATNISTRQNLLGKIHDDIALVAFAGGNTKVLMRAIATMTAVILIAITAAVAAPVAARPLPGAVGSVSGHVSYRGDGVDAEVSAYRLDIPTKEYLLEAAVRVGLQRGDYLISDLPPGRYILKFSDASSRPIFADQYWKNARSMRGGRVKAVNIKGVQLSGYDVEMVRRS